MVIIILLSEQNKTSVKATTLDHLFFLPNIIEMAILVSLIHFLFKNIVNCAGKVIGRKRTEEVIKTSLKSDRILETVVKSKNRIIIVETIIITCAAQSV